MEVTNRQKGIWGIHCFSVIGRMAGEVVDEAKKKFQEMVSAGSRIVIIAHKTVDDIEKNVVPAIRLAKADAVDLSKIGLVRQPEAHEILTLLSVAEDAVDDVLKFKPLFYMLFDEANFVGAGKGLVPLHSISLMSADEGKTVESVAKAE